MIKKALHYGWSVRHQFAKYFAVGMSGFVLDFGLLVFFKEVFGINPTFAVVINQVFVLAYNFSLNKYWTFANKEIPHKQLVRYLMLAVANYLFSVTMMYIFNESLGFDYRLVRVGTILVAVSWNFFLYKYWVYQEDSRLVIPSE
jgi:putative flippase GtrA